MFVAFDRRIRVHLGVVALGTPARLRGCLDALLAHQSEHDFVVSCLVNPATAYDGPLDVDLPDGVHVERPASNLGWFGGPHRLRVLSQGELYVWVQDDMTPMPGWLDALVAAADTHPRVGCFGALRVDEQDRVLPYNGGWAVPPDEVGLWNESDTTADQRPTEVTTLDWVTSKGCLTRTAVFDEVSGPDPRLWPLNHVDKDYCTHVRAHGWDVALVPGARLLHQGSQTSPSSFREFLGGWRDSWFDDRWARPVAALAGRSSGQVEHPCAEWRELAVDAVEAASGQAATRMMVPFARRRAAEEARRTADGVEREAVLRARIEAQVAVLEEARAELAETEQRRQRAVLRARRRRRRLVAVRKRIRAVEPARAPRFTARARRIVRRLR